MNIVFTKWDSRGEVHVLIDGKEYQFTVDAAMIPQWQRVAKYRPGKVFNEIKGTGKLMKEEGGDTMNTSAPKKAMNPVELVNNYKYAGFAADRELHVCPDCRQVYAARAARGKGKSNIGLVVKAAKKLYIFRKEGRKAIAACPCGFRRVEGGMESHSRQWLEEFGDNPITTKPENTPQVTEGPDVPSESCKCQAIRKDGTRCPNHVKPGTAYCGVHKNYKPNF
jgi:hypothetical protein